MVKKQEKNLKFTCKIMLMRKYGIENKFKEKMKFKECHSNINLTWQ